MSDPRVTITDEQAQGISDRLVDTLWPYEYVERDDPKGDRSVIVADAARLTGRLLRFTIEEGTRLAEEHEASR